MNTSTKNLLLGAAMVFLGAGAARAGYETDFDVPPYTLNTTVVGVDGWVATSGNTSSALTGALVVDAPWDSTNTVLRLSRGGSDAYAIRVKNSSFEPLTGEVRVSAGVAFNFNTATNRDAGTHFGFTDATLAASPIRFGVDYNTNGGLYYKGSGLLVNILPKSEIQMNSVYQFTLDIDVVAKTFDITVTGLKLDNTPFQYTASMISSGAFGSIGGVPHLSMLYMENTGNPGQGFITYVDDIGAFVIPEPSSTALLLGCGTIGILFAGRMRRRNGQSAGSSTFSLLS